MEPSLILLFMLAFPALTSQNEIYRRCIAVWMEFFTLPHCFFTFTSMLLQVLYQVSIVEAFYWFHSSKHTYCTVCLMLFCFFLWISPFVTLICYLRSSNKCYFYMASHTDCSSTGIIVKSLYCILIFYWYTFPSIRLRPV